MERIGCPNLAHLSTAGPLSSSQEDRDTVHRMAHHRDHVDSDGGRSVPRSWGAVPREARRDMENDKTVHVEACQNEDFQAMPAEIQIQ